MEKDNQGKKSGSSSNQVTLIEDPFGIPTLRIAEAQLEIDSEESLSRLSAAMDEEEERQSEEAAELAAELSVDEAQAAAERLAGEIAEDVALSEAIQAEDQLVSESVSESESVSDSAAPLSCEEIESSIEALLFISDKPVTAHKLREMLGAGVTNPMFQEGITALRDRYQAVRYGIELVEVAGGYQLRTKPIRAHLSKMLSRVQTQRLSSGAMETLAVVAYRQPVMKDDVDRVRGVDSSHFIRGLLEKRLIRITGRSELPGRPMLYETTPEFLELFGLKDLASMPALRELEQMALSAPLRATDEADPRILEMRRLVGEMKTDQTRLSYDPTEDEKFLKDIREKVNSIPTSSPYLDEQKALEKQALEAAKAPKEPEIAETQLAQPSI